MAENLPKIAAEQNVPVMLIHGAASSFEHNWRPGGWIDLLEESGREVIPVHLPGHGPNPASPEANAADLVRQAAEKHPVVDAVGFSAGGHALLSAAARAPQQFRRLVIIGVGDAAIDGLVKPASPTATAGKGSASRETIADAISGDDEPSDVMLRLFRRLVRTAGNDRQLVAAYLRSDQQQVKAADLPKVDMPALILLGERDFASPADRLVETLPRAEFRQIRGADHFSSTSDFQALDATLAFLDAETTGDQRHA